MTSSALGADARQFRHVVELIAGELLADQPSHTAEATNDQAIFERCQFAFHALFPQNVAYLAADGGANDFGGGVERTRGNRSASRTSRRG